MQTSNLKNMVVLKNLPSNIVDEAIIILKPNKKIKKLEVVDKNRNINTEEAENKTETYILREAEMLVSSYISKLEKANTKEKRSYVSKEKYIRLKKYSIVSTIMLIASIIINFAYNNHILNIKSLKWTYTLTSKSQRKRVVLW